jgi:hypothetical protein
LDAELLQRSRLREVEIWIAWVRLGAVLFAALEVDSEPKQGSTFTLALPASAD